MKIPFKLTLFFLILLLSTGSMTACSASSPVNKDAISNNYVVAGNFQNPVKIKRSLKMLYRVRYILNHAANDFGGHKARAIRNVDKAIFQLKMALQYLRNHQ